jgi:hypothetical protein
MATARRSEKAMALLKYGWVMRLNISREDAKTRRDVERAAAWVNAFSSDGTLTADEERHGFRHMLEISLSRLRVFA